MDTIEKMLQEMKAEKLREQAIALALHEAGHVIMSLLLMREAPYHVIITPETGNGQTSVFRMPEEASQVGLILMAGYAAEHLNDPDQEEKGLGDYMYHDDSDNQEFLALCRDITGSKGLKEDSFIFELKSFECAVDILKTHKALLYSTALEIADAEDFELGYDAIKAFLTESAKAYPILKGLAFPKLTDEKKQELRQDICEYKAAQDAILGRTVEVCSA